MTHDAETATTLQQFLRTISMATPQQVAMTAAKAADHIDAQAAKIKVLKKTLYHYSDIYCEGYCNIQGALDHDCRGCAARIALAATKEPT